MRQLRFEDYLFLDYIDHSNEEALKQLIVVTNQWLYGIIMSFISDSDKAEDILDKITELMVINKRKYNMNEKSISYELFLLAKSEIKKVL